MTTLNYIPYQIENKIGFKTNMGSEVIGRMTKEDWFSYIQKLYVTLLTSDKKRWGYNNTLNYYNTICSYFNFKLI